MTLHYRERQRAKVKCSRGLIARVYKNEPIPPPLHPEHVTQSHGLRSFLIFPPCFCASRHQRHSRSREKSLGTEMHETEITESNERDDNETHNSGEKATRVIKPRRRTNARLNETQRMRSHVFKGRD